MFKIVNMSKQSGWAFESAVYDLLDLIGSIADRAETDREKQAVKRANMYRICFKTSDGDGNIETQQIPLYASFADLYADRTDELTGYSWLKDPVEIVYINRRGKRDPELSLDLTTLFRLCNTDSEMARFVCYFFDAVRYSTSNVSFGRSLERIIAAKEKEFLNDDDEDRAGPPPNSFLQAFREIKKTLVNNPETMTELLSEVGSMAEVANTPAAQEFLAGLTNEDWSISMEAVPQKLAEANELFGKKQMAPQTDEKGEKDQTATQTKQANQGKQGTPAVKDQSTPKPTKR